MGHFSSVPCEQHGIKPDNFTVETENDPTVRGSWKPWRDELYFVRRALGECLLEYLGSSLSSLWRRELSSSHNCFSYLVPSLQILECTCGYAVITSYSRDFQRKEPHHRGARPEHTMPRAELCLELALTSGLSSLWRVPERRSRDGKGRTLSARAEHRQSRKTRPVTLCILVSVPQGDRPHD